MARETRVVSSVGAYATLGMILGAILGFAVSALVASQSQARFEASVLIYRLPKAGGEQAARDFITAAVRKDGFIDSFIEKHQLDTKTKKQLTRGLQIVARDASSPNAQLILVGDDPAGLETTLDALAAYLTQNVRSIADSALESLMSSLNAEIDVANSHYLDLVGKRSSFGKLDTSLEQIVDNIAEIVASKSKLELASRYSFSATSSPDASLDESLLKRLAAQQQRETTRARGLPNVDIAEFEFASALAIADAKLRALRQTKQRLIIEFNQGTPLRVTGGAKIGLIDAEPPQTLLMISACALIGGLLAGIWQSLLLSRDSKFKVPILEKQLKTSVLGVIPKTLIDFGELNRVPMAVSDPDGIPVSAIHGLHVALHFLLLASEKATPIIFSTLRKSNLASHVVANLAISMAAKENQVLIIHGAENNLSSIFGAPKQLNQHSSITIRHVDNTADAKQPQSTGLIDLCQSDSSIAQSNFLKGNFLHYDHILILSDDAPHAKRMLSNFTNAIGVIACSEKDRISKIRRALSNSFAGVIVCGYSLEESAYTGASNRKRQS